MGEVLRIKKNHLLKLIAAFVLGFVVMTGMSMETYAAPKQMADGNLFDAEFYATTYPDVVAVFGMDETLLYNHYLLCGSLEGRLPYAPGAVVVPTVAPTTVAPTTGVKVMPDGNKFDAGFYATRYPDIAAALGTDEALLYNHYLLCGIKEGRLPYAEAEQDLKNQIIYNKIMALQAIYPDGMKWDESNTYIQPKEENRDNGWAGLTRRACQAFAYTIQDAVFGSSAKVNWYQTGLDDWCIRNAGGQIVASRDTDWAWVPVGYVGQDPVINAKFEEYWNKIQVGDGIADGNHIMIVLTKADDHVTVVEGNNGGKVRWGRKIPKDILRISLSSVETPSW